MKKIIFIGVVLVVLVVATAVGAAFYFQPTPVIVEPVIVEQVGCTKEAMVCPDGSTVGRTGPKCEFTPCPEVKVGTGVIQGKVDVGPICPVEREGVPCPVPPEAYTSREIILYALNETTVVKRMYFLYDGTYRFEVPAGNYVLDIPRQQGPGGSSELPKAIAVVAGQTISFNFSIDTGIR